MCQTAVRVAQLKDYARIGVSEKQKFWIESVFDHVLSPQIQLLIRHGRASPDLFSSSVVENITQILRTRCGGRQLRVEKHSARLDDAASVPIVVSVPVQERLGTIGLRFCAPCIDRINESVDNFLL